MALSGGVDFLFLNIYGILFHIKYEKIRLFGCLEYFLNYCSVSWRYWGCKLWLILCSIGQLFQVFILLWKMIDVEMFANRCLEYFSYNYFQVFVLACVEPYYNDNDLCMNYCFVTGWHFCSVCCVLRTWFYRLWLFHNLSWLSLRWSHWQNFTHKYSII